MVILDSICEGTVLGTGIKGSGDLIKKSVKLDLEAILNELRVNLENNYKDLAHDALKKLQITLDTYKDNGAMKEKDYLKYKKIADDYSKRMENYHH